MSVREKKQTQYYCTKDKNYHKPNDIDNSSDSDLYCAYRSLYKQCCSRDLVTKKLFYMDSTHRTNSYNFTLIGDSISSWWV